MNPHEIRFAADRMLGKLARMLRLLGYDTLYARDFTPLQLIKTLKQEQRVVLTRGNVEKRFPALENVFAVKSDNAGQQLREVVVRFRLDTRAGLWTRCTLCNETIERVEKGRVASLVPPKVFEVYEEFYRCSGCDHVYWQGSHVARILNNLKALLGE